MVILDTNIIIDHLRQYPRNKKSVLDDIIKKITPNNLFLSVISMQELFAGDSTRNKQLEEWVLDVISPFKILPYTEKIARLAGQIERDLGRLIEFPDAAIAATAIINRASLFTLNKKDFRGIKNLELLD